MPHLEEEFRLETSSDEYEKLDNGSLAYDVLSFESDSSLEN